MSKKSYKILRTIGIDYTNCMVMVRPAPSEATRYQGCRTANVRLRQKNHIIWSSDDDAIDLNAELFKHMGWSQKLGQVMGDGVPVSTDGKEKKQMLLLVKQKKPIHIRSHINQVTNWQLSLFTAFCFVFSIGSLHGIVMHIKN